MRADPLILLALLSGGCVAPLEAKRVTEDPFADTDSDTDTAPLPDTGATEYQLGEDAVGSCVDDLTGATSVPLTTLYDGDLAYDEGDWEEVPAVRVLGDATAWVEFRAATGLALEDVDFAVNRVAVATDFRHDTCGLSVLEVAGWALTDGSTHVDVRMRTDGGEGCEDACTASGSRMLVLLVPSSGGVLACRRTETWCGAAPSRPR